jgi:hypothetical protein
MACWVPTDAWAGSAIDAVVIVLKSGGGANGAGAGCLEAVTVGRKEASVSDELTGIKTPTNAVQATRDSPVKNDLVGEGEAKNRVCVITHKTAESAGRKFTNLRNRDLDGLTTDDQSELLRESIAARAACVGDSNKKVREHEVELSLGESGGGGGGRQAPLNILCQLRNEVDNVFLCSNGRASDGGGDGDGDVVAGRGGGRVESHEGGNRRGRARKRNVSGGEEARGLGDGRWRGGAGREEDEEGETSLERKA